MILPEKSATFQDHARRLLSRGHASSSAARGTWATFIGRSTHSFLLTRSSSSRQRRLSSISNRRVDLAAVLLVIVGSVDHFAPSIMPERSYSTSPTVAKSGSTSPNAWRQRERRRSSTPAKQSASLPKNNKRDERREHENFAMREIHHPDDAEDHRIADRDEAVDRASPVDQLLQEECHRKGLDRGWTLGCGMVRLQEVMILVHHESARRTVMSLYNS